MVKSLKTIKQKIKVKFFVEDCTYVGLALSAEIQNKVATQMCLFYFILYIGMSWQIFYEKRRW